MNPNRPVYLKLRDQIAAGSWGQPTSRMPPMSAAVDTLEAELGLAEPTIGLVEPRQLAQHLRALASTGWYWLVLASAGWCRLVPAGAGWCWLGGRQELA